MQIKLNQYEIQQALTEFLQKRSSTTIKLTAFDLKGMRSEEGYHANVEIEYEDVSYEEIVPKLVSFASQKDEESKPEPVKQSEPEMSEESRGIILKVLNLLNTNVQHCNTTDIIELTSNSSEEVKKYFENNPVYKSTLEDFMTKVEEDLEELEELEEKEKEEELEEKEEEIPQENLNPLISQGETPIKLNIFGKPINSDSSTSSSTTPIFG